ncbi:probable 2-oxoglutarate-dependent dioxygenase SLC1 isoform X2 [Elaeis guineensis]|uniref:Protein DMR6-LIKE OXYGENASE 2 isoform X2 n=1 Tax=Elaeis guineensis var. tenera TaxID=51953 RepID=A0A6I9SBW9_ELAGV|nr:protein DMR6-LIKE OXYGENASE 2 isoform X2 [Elaeis guineensis]
MVMDLEIDGQESAESTYMKGVRHLCESGITKVPRKYILPVSERPQLIMKKERTSTCLNLKLPIIDLARLHTSDRSQVLESLAEACKVYGFFQVVNHNISCNAMRRMIDVGRRFFKLPFEERVKHMSTDIRSPVRYGTSFNQTKDGVFCWRDFLKLYCHPLDTVIPFWPSSPSDLREEVTSYAMQAKSLFLALMEAILETLGVNTSILREFDDDGSHLLVVNCYPACPEPHLTLGMPPHSDYGFLTLLLQDDVEGLQVQCEGEWVTVEPVPNSLVVNIGDHFEIFSNGMYKSVLHRVLVNSSTSRMSVASLHSLPPDKMVSPSPELVNKKNPRLYKDTNFAAFLDYMSSCDTKHKNFLESRKLTQGKDEAKSQ